MRNDVKKGQHEMKTNQISVKSLARLLKEDIQRDFSALEEARTMFLAECRSLVIAEGGADDADDFDGANRAYKASGGFAGYDGISPEEYQWAYRELHKKYWPDMDPVTQPYIPRKDVGKKSTEFQAELDAKIRELQASRNIKPSDQQEYRTQQLAADVEYYNKSGVSKFWDGLNDSVGDKWGWIKKYAKAAGIGALILGVVFLIVYGLRQAIEMIRSMRNTKREGRDASAVTMKLPFKNDEQVEQFCEVVKKKMSRYVEIESINGTTVEVTCDQDYIRKHIGEIQAAIREIKAEKRNEEKLAAESRDPAITFSQLKKIILA